MIRFGLGLLAGAAIISTIFFFHLPKTQPEEAEVYTLVREFGSRLKNISTLLPPEELYKEVSQNYGDLITPELLEMWHNNPQFVLGRETSSPWPDRIDISSVEKVEGYNSFKVKGRVIETVNGDKGTLDRVASYPVELYVAKIGDTWKIDGALRVAEDVQSVSATSTRAIFTNNLESLKDGLTYRYSWDKNGVYFDTPLYANLGTFHPINNGAGYQSYATDGQKVFYEAQVIASADPKTFQILWEPTYEGCGTGEYAKDANHVYYKAEIVPGADPATFVTLPETNAQYGKDKRGYYIGTEYVGPTADPAKLACSYG